jgi:hypothetical protein
MPGVGFVGGGAAVAAIAAGAAARGRHGGGAPMPDEAMLLLAVMFIISVLAVPVSYFVIKCRNPVAFMPGSLAVMVGLIAMAGQMLAAMFIAAVVFVYRSLAGG